MQPVTIFDHNPDLLILYMLFIMGILLIGTFPQIKSNTAYSLSMLWTYVLSFAMILFPIQCQDFAHMVYSFTTNSGISHYEKVYVDLWEWWPNTIIHRCVIFGGALTILFISFRILKLNRKFASFIFVITLLFYFGAYRNYLGLTMMFLGIIIILNNKKVLSNLSSIIIGIILILLSLEFHKSMLLYVLLLLPTFINFDKKTIITSILAFPFIYGSIFILGGWFATTIGNADMAELADVYSSLVRETTIMKTITEWIVHISYMYLMYIVWKSYLKNPKVLTKPIAFLLKYSYILYYLGFCFYGQNTGGWLYSRFIEAGNMSFVFVIIYYFYSYPRTRYVKFAFSGFIFYIIYNMLYISTYARSVYENIFNNIIL